MTTPIHARFSSVSDAAMPANPNDYDQRQSLADPYASRHDDAAQLGGFRRPSPDIEPSSSDPLRAQFQDYDADSNPSSRRESFLESDLEMRKYQGLSASGVAGYQAVGPGDVSEPGSPIQGEGYERSNESGSSGTKVDQAGRSVRPVTMSSDGSYDARDRTSGHAHTVRSSLSLVGDGALTSPLSPWQSESGHIEGDYNQRNNSTGYADAGLYHSSSPSSGRYREGSFGHASGIESGRASTIGTDHGAPSIPFNSSRVALNNDWRTSYDQGSDIGGGGRGRAVSEVAPGKEGYGRAEGRQYDDEIEKQPMEGGGQTYAAILPHSPAVGMNEKFPGGASDPPTVVISRTNRLEWIDGVRGIASLIIFTHHFADLTWSERFPNTLSVGSIEGFLRYASRPSLSSLARTDVLLAHAGMDNSPSPSTSSSVVESSPRPSSNPPSPSPRLPSCTETTSPRSLPPSSRSPVLAGSPFLRPSSADRSASPSPPLSSASSSGRSASTVS